MKGSAKNQCPICDSTVTFQPFGVRPRPGALCPSCGSLERHRLIWLFLRDETRVLSGGIAILHLAPEPCLAKRLSRLPKVRYISGDLDPKRAPRLIDARSIPFADGSFDLILCSHVLEHIPDDLAAMREIYRVLGPGRRAILQVPLDPRRAKTFEDPTITSPAGRERAFGQRDHVRVYGLDYGTRLSKVGFQIKFSSYARSLPKSDIVKYGLLIEDIFLVTKPRDRR